MKSIRELRKLSTVELEKDLKSTQEALLKLRFKKVVDEVTDTTQIRKAKRKIARIKTLLRENELASVAEKK